MAVTPPSSPPARPRERASARTYPPSRFHRWLFIKTVLGAVVRLFSRVEAEGLERYPQCPAIVCFTHQNWIDPFYIVGVLPKRPRIYFFGPEQEDMTKGFRNRLIDWGGAGIPYKPGRRGLVAATHGVEAAIRSGGSVAIAGEGSIHSGESVVLPLLDGPAYFALRTGVPIVPLTVNGTSWLRFRAPVRVRVGDPILPPEPWQRRPTPEAAADLTARTWAALNDLAAGYPDPQPPGRFLRWLTDLFNDWQGPRPPVPIAAPAAPDGAETEGRRS